VQATKDPTAIAIAQKALLAMGGSALANYQDSYATGSVTIYGDTGTLNFPAVLRSKGLRQFRYEIQKLKGTDSYTTDGTAACIARANGTFEADGILALVAQRIDYLPAFSLVSEYANPSLSIQYVGTANVNGQPADVISLSFNVTVPGYGPGQIGKRNVFVDQVTGLVTKIQGYQVDDATPDNTSSLELYFLNYQNVSGIAVPFSILKVMDGRNTSLLALSSVTFNTGLSDSLFSATCGVPNAQ
jgi:hypothetical protein